MKTRRDKVWSLLNEGKGAGATIDALIIALIAANVVVVVIESDPLFAVGEAEPWFHGFEIFASIVFTIEYLLRLWTAVESPPHTHPVWGRLRYARSPMALVDLIAILPFWLPILATMDTRVMRALRLFRLFRLLKISRYSRPVTALVRVFARKKEQLSMTFFAVSLVLVIFASLIYFVENPAQPLVFTSIPQTMWWATATLTTVGYGDMYPITTLGQILGGFISFTGVVIIAVPAGIVASGFTEEVEEERRRVNAAGDAEQRTKRAHDASARGAPPPRIPDASHDDRTALVCPHCGKGIAAHVDIAT